MRDIHGVLKGIHGACVNEEEEVGLVIVVVGIESVDALEPLW